MLKTRNPGKWWKTCYLYYLKRWFILSFLWQHHSLIKLPFYSLSWTKNWKNPPSAHTIMDVESKISGKSGYYLFFIIRKGVLRWAASFVVLELLDQLALKRHSVPFVWVVLKSLGFYPQSLVVLSWLSYLTNVVVFWQFPFSVGSFCCFIEASQKLTKHTKQTTTTTTKQVQEGVGCGRW